VGSNIQGQFPGSTLSSQVNIFRAALVLCLARLLMISTHFYYYLSVKSHKRSLGNKLGCCGECASVGPPLSSRSAYTSYPGYCTAGCMGRQRTAERLAVPLHGMDRNDGLYTVDDRHMSAPAPGDGNRYLHPVSFAALDLLRMSICLYCNGPSLLNHLLYYW
jgi:hypothetical protein